MLTSPAFGSRLYALDIFVKPYMSSSGHMYRSPCNEHCQDVINVREVQLTFRDIMNRHQTVKYGVYDNVDET